MTEKTNPVLTVDLDATDELVPEENVLVVPLGSSPNGHPMYRVTATLGTLTTWLHSHYADGDVQAVADVLATARYATLGHAFRVGNHATPESIVDPLASYDPASGLDEKEYLKDLNENTPH
jgi:hypothetical protein